MDQYLVFYLFLSAVGAKDKFFSRHIKLFFLLLIIIIKIVDFPVKQPIAFSVSRRCDNP